MRIVRSVLFVAVLSSPALAAAGAQTAADHASHPADAGSVLVQKVRDATEALRNASQVPVGYQSVLGCVSGPDAGAMGVHFVNGALLGDDVLDPAHPEALIYEFHGSIGRLVGVEFIVFADVWHLTHAPNDPPVLEGQLLNFYDAPNRFGLPAFYELHVWAWRDNPNGAFVDWNPRVSCEGR
jgi:hypothetical protein